MKIKYYLPLILFLVPTWILPYFLWPEAFSHYPDQGKESFIGMLAMWTAMAVNYYLGIRSVLKDTSGK